MSPWKKSFSALVLSGASALGGVVGYHALQHGNWAFAKEPEALTEPDNASRRAPAPSAAIAKAEDLATVFRHVGKQVEPAVVNINVRKMLKVGRRAAPFDRETLRRFFPDGENLPDVPENFGDADGQDGNFEQVGTGSGVILEVNGDVGYVLTNNHVAGGAEEFLITLNDGREITKAKLLGADAKTDLAVLKIEGARLPQPAKWGNSDDLEKGDWIMAFGSPFGYVGSMTHGIVSALNRTNVGILPQQGYESFIQVDAPINPGNSGGPLVNLHGEVVGVNTAIASRSGGFQGIGFAIPSNQAKFVYAQLKDKGKVVRGWLGVSIADVAKNTDVVERLGYTGTTGVLVEDAFTKTPAFGKLKRRDIVTELNGKPVENVQQLRNTIAASAPNTDVTMKVLREGKPQDVTIKLGEQPEDLGLAAAGTTPRRTNRANRDTAAPEVAGDALGMKFATVTDDLARRFRLDSTDGAGGAVVVEVARNSVAARAGIAPGDVIAQVDNKEIKSGKEAAEALAKADLADKGVLLDISSREGHRTILLKEKKVEKKVD